MTGFPDFSTTQDRRNTSRFPMDREVRYRILETRKHHPQCAGKTLDMSSKGILFETVDAVPVGKRLEISVNWPAQLNKTCRLKFVALAKVVWSDGKRVAVTIERHEFRTQGANNFAPIAEVDLRPRAVSPR
ncbi:MAG: PilZ domain-containing protein [Bryobacteraceae bacterium]